MRFLSLCSGIEAASVAWKDLGWEAAGFAEIEAFPSAVLAHHFPNTPNHGDITQHHQWPIQPGSIDLICGGPPCQSFSIAGMRKGMADPRGNLTLTYLAIVDRLRPRWIVYENVPGLLSSGGGADFASLIEGLALCGYGVAWRVLDPAQSQGGHHLPQRRRRVFIVGHLGDPTPAITVLFKQQGGTGHPAEGNKEGQGVASGPASCVGEDGKPISFQPGNLMRHAGSDPSTTATTTLKASMGDQMPHICHPVILDRASFNQGENAQYEPKIEETETCPTVIAKGPHAVAQPPMYAVRRLTVTECLRLQGFPDGWTQIPWRGKPAEACPDGLQYKAIGNSWAVPMARWIGERIQAFENGTI